jgi:hypothetical protein
MFDLRRKIIFIHPPKTGGTTIEAAFKWHPNFNQNLGSGYVTFFNKFKHAGLTEHIENLNKLGIDCKDFFKFACIRNPWDLTVSRFFHDKQVFKLSNEEEEEPYYYQSFDIYVKTRLKDLKFEWTKIEKYFFYKNEYSMNYIIRYENYKNDCETIFKKYNVWWPETNYNASSRPSGTSYKEMFKNINTKNLVEKYAKEYIKFFGYTF